MADPSSGLAQNVIGQIPPHLVAEAMHVMNGGDVDTVHMMDVRWSAPISPAEMSFVEDYVRRLHPDIFIEQANMSKLAVVAEEDDNSPDHSPTASDSQSRQMADQGQLRTNTLGSSSGSAGGAGAIAGSNTGTVGYLRTSPPSQNPASSSPQITQFFSSRWAPSGTVTATEPCKAQLMPSRLREIMSAKQASLENSMSVTELHARHKVMQRCGVDHSEYHVVFTAGAQEALLLVAEAYPFHIHNVYLTALEEQNDSIAACARGKEAKVINVRMAWLDLTIPGSQLSTHFRRKSKSNPKGLFAYPLAAGELRNPLHWVSESQRNLWHVLLDASNVALDTPAIDMQAHKPDYLICIAPKIVGYPTRVYCLLVRRTSQSPASSPMPQ